MDPIRFDTTLKSTRLRTELRHRLLSGEYQPGDRLPSEPELITLYGVSRATLREVIASLVHEGLLNRVQGKGTYVAEKRPVQLTLAVVMPYLFFSDSDYPSAGAEVIPRLVQAIETEARQMRASILLYLDNLSPQVERENIENLLSRNVDAVLLNYIGGEENRDCLERIVAAGLPLVLIDRYVDSFLCDYVITDNVWGGQQATQILLDQGFSRILYLTPSLYNTALRDRLQGYEQAMRQAGQIPQVFFTGEPADEKFAFQHIEEALRSTEPPFAVFTAEAPLLARACRSVQERGLPSHQMAFACFDEPSLRFSPEVLFVKVEQPLREIGRHALQILREKLAHNRRTIHQVRLQPAIHVEVRK